ncbi:MAG: aminotransferase class I/II-fold pyridoxal phosphate-dependent enzyme [Spirochaetaceae bacterium]|nr:MAG: aminotransferase class I/II-fold pyridoxal phosphate-dependent enzyme [Spirochaetaceae bacterium]
MNELARQLNTALENTITGALLSARGRRIYFPRGIVAQSAEAKEQAHKLNATAGIAVQGGQPLHLSPIRAHIPDLSPEEIFSYAPTAGHPRLRELWRREMLEKNPSLKGKRISLPIVVSGLTHGLSVLADLFVEPGDMVILPDLYWGNYRLIFEDRMEALIRTFPLFDEAGALNLQGLAKLLTPRSAQLSAQAAPPAGSSRASSGERMSAKVILVLNFPNNPTGYSPIRAEAEQLHALLSETAETGRQLLLICDDAYFGLFYEPEIYPQSLFAEAADLHKNILAVKVDGATKENLVWGFRVGFLTFASRGMAGQEDAFQALSQKVLGAVRSSISNSSTLGQNLLMRGMQAPNYEEEKQRMFGILEARYRRSREILNKLEGPLRVLPFNSGYFLCFDTGGVSAERLRQRLLRSDGIGTISIQDRYLRVAYSSVDLENLEELYGTIMRRASELS